MRQDERPFLFLSANTPWVYALAESLAAEDPVHAVRLYDWRTYWAQQPSWPKPPDGGDLRRTLKALPTGYAGRLEPLLRPYLRYKLRRWQEQLRDRSGADPWVVAPYFYLAPWVTREVDAGRLVYYNLDEYTRYRPNRSDEIRTQEDRLVERAAHTVCLSKYQVQTLRERHPEHAGQIHHFPLGVQDEYINPDPTRTPTPETVGYVGNLTDRVDWDFVHDVVTRLSEYTFVFAGGIEEESDPPEWKRTRRAVFDRPNVRHLGRIPQAEVTEVYWSCAVNWIPYDPEHPFNVASCPTKVMDMIASGRPVVSTPVPECTLYPEWIEIAESPSEAGSTIRTASENHRDETAARQTAFAREQTWDARARRFRNILHGVHA